MGSTLLEGPGATLQPPDHTPCLVGGRELDWCRNYLSPFSQHSSPRAEMPGAEVTALPLCLCHSQGEALVGGAEGPHPFGLPCTLPYLSPLARNLLFLFCQSTTIVYVPIPPPPPWGEGRVQGPACSTFSILELYQIKSLLFVQFFTASIQTAFFHTYSPCLLKLRSLESLLENQRNLGNQELLQSQSGPQNLRGAIYTAVYC